MFREERGFRHQHTHRSARLEGLSGTILGTMPRRRAVTALPPTHTGTRRLLVGRAVAFSALLMVEYACRTCGARFVPRGLDSGAVRGLWDASRACSHRHPPRIGNHLWRNAQAAMGNHLTNAAAADLA